jgi:hypothetical protein
MGEEVGGMAQVVEHLPSKCKTINSNPSTWNEKKKKEAFQRGKW